jgi:hypothetical protein
MSPFAFFLLPLFSSVVFFDEPMNEGSKGTPLFMAPLVCLKALVKCKLTLLAISTWECHDFWGMKLLLMLQGTKAPPH